MKDPKLEIACINRVCVSSREANTVGSGHFGKCQESKRDLVFVATLDDGSQAGERIDEHRAAVFASDLALRRAIFAPILATILRAAASAKLELGETLIVSGDSPIARLLGQIGKWWAPQRILLEFETPATGKNGRFLHTINVSDETAAEQLTSLLVDQPRVVVWDFSGDSSAWNLILNASSRFMRIIASAPFSDSMTIDFYNNVHRKGVSIIGAPIAFDQIYRPKMVNSLFPYLALTENLLKNDDFADMVVSCLAYDSC